MEKLKILKNTMTIFLFLVIFTGVLYPFFIYLCSQILFPFQANGSMISVNKTVIASTIIGQNFTQNKYLWSRPSATGGYPYNPLQSGSNNYSLTNKKLFHQISQEIHKLQIYNKYDSIPIDLVTSSGSGLDPNISLASAYYQMNRIAKSRGVSLNTVKKIIDSHVDSFLFINKPMVNVLLVNLDLDAIIALKIKNSFQEFK